MNVVLAAPAVGFTYQHCTDPAVCFSETGSREACPCVPDVTINLQDADEYFKNQPAPVLVDTQGARVTSSYLSVSVSMHLSSPCISLFGTSSRVASSGVALFAELGAMGSDSCSYPVTATMRVTAAHDDVGMDDHDILPFDSPLIVDRPVTLMAIKLGPSNAVAGIPPLLPISLELFGLCKNVGCVGLEGKLGSTRFFQVSIRPVGPKSTPSGLAGRTQVKAAQGFATFTDLAFLTTGTFVLDFNSTQGGRTVPLVTSQPFRVSSNDVARITIVKQPQAAVAGEPACGTTQVRPTNSPRERVLY